MKKLQVELQNLRKKSKLSGICIFQRCSRNMIIPFAIQFQNLNRSYTLFITTSFLEFYKLTPHTLSSESSKTIFIAPEQARKLEDYKQCIFFTELFFCNNAILLHL